MPYVPAGHGTCVGDTAPLGHQYPAVHSPLQAAVMSPAAVAYAPAGHAAASAEVDPCGAHVGGWLVRAAASAKSHALRDFAPVAT